MPALLLEKFVISSNQACKRVIEFNMTEDNRIHIKRTQSRFSEQIHSEVTITASGPAPGFTDVPSATSFDVLECESTASDTVGCVPHPPVGYSGSVAENFESNDPIFPATPHSKPTDTLEDMFDDLVKQLPSSAWAELPVDLSSNVDHYLYGAPKK